MYSSKSARRLLGGHALVLSGVALLALASSCPPAQVQTEVIKIDPTRLTTRCGWAHDSATFSCFPHVCSHPYHEETCKFIDFITPNLGPILVGFDHWYDPGTQPCACWDWFTDSRRAYVLFGDLRKLAQRKVVWAKLHWGETATGESRESCPATLFQVTGPAVSYDPPATEIAAAAPSGVFVTDTVKSWNAGRDNHGFMFTPDREAFGEEPSRKCLSQRGDFVLEVAVVTP